MTNEELELLLEVITVPSNNWDLHKSTILHSTALKHFPSVFGGPKNIGSIGNLAGGALYCAVGNNVEQAIGYAPKNVADTASFGKNSGIMFSGYLNTNADTKIASITIDCSRKNVIDFKNVIFPIKWAREYPELLKAIQNRFDIVEINTINAKFSSPRHLAIFERGGSVVEWTRLYKADPQLPLPQLPLITDLTSSTKSLAYNKGIGLGIYAKDMPELWLNHGVRAIYDQNIQRIANVYKFNRSYQQPVKIWDVSAKTKHQHLAHPTQGIEELTTMPWRPGISKGRRVPWYNRPNYPAWGRLAGMVIGPALFALDVYNRSKNERLLFPNYSETAHNFAVATDVVLDYGTFALLASKIPFGAAAIALSATNFMCNLADGIRDIKPESMKDNRDLFITSISALNLSPQREMEWIQAFDRGEPWTRKFNIATAQVTMTSIKPFEWLHDIKTGVVNFGRYVGELQDRNLFDFSENEAQKAWKENIAEGIYYGAGKILDYGSNFFFTNVHGDDEIDHNNHQRIADPNNILNSCGPINQENETQSDQDKKDTNPTLESASTNSYQRPIIYNNKTYDSPVVIPTQEANHGYSHINNKSNKPNPLDFNVYFEQSGFNIGNFGVTFPNLIPNYNVTIGFDTDGIKEACAKWIEYHLNAMDGQTIAADKKTFFGTQYSFELKFTGKGLGQRFSGTRFKLVIKNKNTKEKTPYHFKIPDADLRNAEDRRTLTHKVETLFSEHVTKVIKQQIAILEKKLHLAIENCDFKKGKKLAREFDAILARDNKAVDRVLNIEHSHYLQLTTVTLTALLTSVEPLFSGIPLKLVRTYRTFAPKINPEALPAVLKAMFDHTTGSRRSFHNLRKNLFGPLNKRLNIFRSNKGMTIASCSCNILDLANASNLLTNDLHIFRNGIDISRNYLKWCAATAAAKDAATATAAVKAATKKVTKFKQKTSFAGIIGILDFIGPVLEGAIKELEKRGSLPENRLFYAAQSTLGLLQSLVMCHINPSWLAAIAISGEFWGFSSKSYISSFFSLEAAQAQVINAIYLLFDTNRTTAEDKYRFLTNPCSEDNEHQHQAIAIAHRTAVSDALKNNNLEEIIKLTELGTRDGKTIFTSGNKNIPVELLFDLIPIRARALLTKKKPISEVTILVPILKNVAKENNHSAKSALHDLLACIDYYHNQHFSMLYYQTKARSQSYKYSTLNTENVELYSFSSIYRAAGGYISSFFGNKPQLLLEAPKPKAQEKTPPKNEVKKANQGYVIYQTTPNGDCGYEAFGITRKDAMDLLIKNLQSISEILKPLILEALLTNNFCDYLIHNGHVHANTTNAEIEYDTERFSNDINVILGYLNYDIYDRNIDAGWTHPTILQALAYIKHVELHIWVLDERNALIPHRIGDRDYGVYTPPNAKSRRDLLFVNGNHFDRVIFHGYKNDAEIPNDSIFPFIPSQIQEDDQTQDTNTPEFSTTNISDLKDKLSMIIEKSQGECSTRCIIATIADCLLNKLQGGVLDLANIPFEFDDEKNPIAIQFISGKRFVFLENTLDEITKDLFVVLNGIIAFTFALKEKNKERYFEFLDKARACGFMPELESHINTFYNNITYPFKKELELHREEGAIITMDLKIAKMFGEHELRGIWKEKYEIVYYKTVPEGKPYTERVEKSICERVLHEKTQTHKAMYEKVLNQYDLSTIQEYNFLQQLLFTILNVPNYCKLTIDSIAHKINLNNMIRKIIRTDIQIDLDKELKKTFYDGKREQMPDSFILAKTITLLKRGANPDLTVEPYLWQLFSCNIAKGKNYYVLHRVLEITDASIRNQLIQLFIDYGANFRIRSPFNMSLLEHFLSLETTWPKDDKEHLSVRQTLKLLTEAGVNPYATPRDGLYDIEADNALNRYAINAISAAKYRNPIGHFLRAVTGDYSNQKSWAGYSAGAIVQEKIGSKKLKDYYGPVGFYKDNYSTTRVASSKTNRIVRGYRI